MFKPTESISSSVLADIPNVYLYDRSNWTEFKKILNECGGTWNFPHWMTTIVRGGEEWKLMCEAGHPVDQVFPIGKAGMEEKSTDLASKMIASLGLPKNLGENIRNDVQYCCLSTLEFEDSRRLPARQKMWAWITKSLKGTRPSVGPYHYLIDEVKAYDIAALFKRRVKVLEQITICSLDDELEKVLSVAFDPNKQNVFSYLGELRKAIKGLHDLNERLPLNGRIVLPDAFVKSKLIRAARQVPIYKPVIDMLLMSEVDEWANLTSDKLYQTLESVSANQQAVYQTQNTSSGQTAFDGVKANAAYQRPREKQSEKSEKEKGVCFNFQKGTCSKTDCRFRHEKPEQKRDQKSSVSSTNSTDAPAPKCGACGGAHFRKDCTSLKGKCGWCSSTYHTEAMCKLKKEGKPKASVAVVDGFPARAFCVRVCEPVVTVPSANVVQVLEPNKSVSDVQALSAISSSPPPPGL